VVNCITERNQNVPSETPDEALRLTSLCILGHCLCFKSGRVTSSSTGELNLLREGPFPCTYVRAETISRLRDSNEREFRLDPEEIQIQIHP